MRNTKSLAQKYNIESPIYLDNAMYIHDHGNLDEKQREFYGVVKNKLGKNHNQKELRVLINGIFQTIKNN